VCSPAAGLYLQINELSCVKSSLLFNGLCTSTSLVVMTTSFTLGQGETVCFYYRSKSKAGHHAVQEPHLGMQPKLQLPTHQYCDEGDAER
jgi:hypothetical protein